MITLTEVLELSPERRTISYGFDPSRNPVPPSALNPLFRNDIRLDCQAVIMHNNVRFQVVASAMQGQAKARLAVQFME
jgi:hypothetical protein